MIKFVSTLFAALFVFSSAHSAQPRFFQVETRVSQNPLTLKIELKALHPAKINQEAPLSGEVKPGAGVVLQTAKFNKTSAQVNTTHSLVWELPLKASGQKHYEVNGHLSFYLCTDKWCRKFETDFIEKFGEKIA